jgi:raffinose/stachyose/melibiose transport system permease protein
MNASATTARILLVGFSLLSVLFLVPIGVLVMSAVRTDADYLTHGVFSFPHSFDLQNFVEAWKTGSFSTTYTNSVIITVVKVPLGLLISALAAYPLAKMRFRFDNALFLFFVAGLAIPIHVALLPLFVMERKLGMLGSIWALLPPYLAFGIPFQVFVLRGFMKLVPTELIEAARMDGASEFRIFRKIMLPLIAPALATLAILDAVATWNELLMALVLLPAAESQTLPLGLLKFFSQFSGSQTLLSAGLVIGVVPLLIVYLLLQRYLVSGLVGGAVKG